MLGKPGSSGCWESSSELGEPGAGSGNHSKRESPGVAGAGQQDHSAEWDERMKASKVFFSWLENRL